MKEILFAILAQFGADHSVDTVPSADYNLSSPADRGDMLETMPTRCPASPPDGSDVDCWTEDAGAGRIETICRTRRTFVRNMECTWEVRLSSAGDVL